MQYRRLSRCSIVIVATAITITAIVTTITATVITTTGGITRGIIGAITIITTTAVVRAFTSASDRDIRADRRAPQGALLFSKAVALGQRDESRPRAYYAAWHARSGPMSRNNTSEDYWELMSSALCNRELNQFGIYWPDCSA